MNTKSALLTVMGLLVISSSICSAVLCPHNDDVANKIPELANTGKATFQNETYKLIGRESTGIFYTGKFLENDTQLNGFLQVSKLLDSNLPEKAEARLIALLPNPNFCAYKISLGDNTQVIALSTER
jgi:hypothetical protein